MCKWLRVCPTLRIPCNTLHYPLVHFNTLSLLLCCALKYTDGTFRNLQNPPGTLLLALLHCSTLYDWAVPFSTLQYIAVLWSTLQYPFSSLQNSALPVQYFIGPDSTLYYLCSTFRNSGVPCSTLSVPCSTLQYLAVPFQYRAVPFSALSVPCK